MVILMSTVLVHVNIKRYWMTKTSPNAVRILNTWVLPRVIALLPGIRNEAARRPYLLINGCVWQCPCLPMSIEYWKKFSWDMDNLQPVHLCRARLNMIRLTKRLATISKRHVNYYWKPAFRTVIMMVYWKPRMVKILSFRWLTFRTVMIPAAWCCFWEIYMLVQALSWNQIPLSGRSWWKISNRKTSMPSPWPGPQVSK